MWHARDSRHDKVVLHEDPQCFNDPAARILFSVANGETVEMLKWEPQDLTFHFMVGCMMEARSGYSYSQSQLGSCCPWLPDAWVDPPDYSFFCFYILKLKNI